KAALQGLKGRLGVLLPAWRVVPRLPPREIPPHEAGPIEESERRALAEPIAEAWCEDLTEEIAHALEAGPARGRWDRGCPDGVRRSARGGSRGPQEPLGPRGRGTAGAGGPVPGRPAAAGQDAARHLLGPTARRGHHGWRERADQLRPYPGQRAK